MNLTQLEMETSQAIESPVVIDIPKGLESLAERYLGTRLRELNTLQGLLERSDFEELRRLSHNLKGTGTSYGFPDVTRLGAAIERASKAGDSSDIAIQMLALSTYVNAAAQQLGLAK